MAIPVHKSAEREKTKRDESVMQREGVGERGANVTLNASAQQKQLYLLENPVRQFSGNETEADKRQKQAK